MLSFPFKRSCSLAASSSVQVLDFGDLRAAPDRSRLPVHRAFSREAVDVLRWPGHRYASFNQARDDFARALDRLTRFKAAGVVELENAIVGDPDVTTGDHDGRAVLLRAGAP